MNNNSDHVVLGTDGAMLCRHCQATEILVMPVSVTDMCSRVDSFINRHRACLPAYDSSKNNG